MITTRGKFVSDVSAADKKGSFDAHAVYAGDDAVSAGRWSNLATIGIRNALSALMSRYGLETYNPSPTVAQAPGNSLIAKSPQRLHFLSSASTSAAF